MCGEATDAQVGACAQQIFSIDQLCFHHVSKALPIILRPEFDISMEQTVCTANMSRKGGSHDLASVFLQQWFNTALKAKQLTQGLSCSTPSPGLEYELLLSQELTAARVPFWTEADLRLQGLHKTPDARLKVNICATHLSVLGPSFCRSGQEGPVPEETRIIVQGVSGCSWERLFLHSSQIISKNNISCSLFQPTPLPSPSPVCPVSTLNCCLEACYYLTSEGGTDFFFFQCGPVRRSKNMCSKWQASGSQRSGFSVKKTFFF